MWSTSTEAVVDAGVEVEVAVRLDACRVYQVLRTHSDLQSSVCVREKETVCV